jgi:Ala-tRNA(Pro) deacylase
MGCKEELEGYLRENKVAFQVQHHAVAYTAQEVAAAEHVPGRMLAKVVMVFGDDQLAMLVLPAPSRVNLEQAAAVLGAKDARLAQEEEFADRFRGCEVGAMPPFGQLYDLPVYVDKSLAEDETIVFEAGTHTDTMSMKFADYERLVKPKLAEFARHV